MDEGVIMNYEEKVERCTNAKTDINGRCKVYSRWMVHNTIQVHVDGCADCSFATISRKDGKPVKRV